MLRICKLANPSIKNSLKGISKGNKWFIDMFNYLQHASLDKHNNLSSVWGKNVDEDPMVTFIKTILMEGVRDIYSFTSVSNKMTSNECLTALMYMFNNIDSPIT